MEFFRSLSVQDFSSNGEIRPEKRRFSVRSEAGRALLPSTRLAEPQDTYLAHCQASESTQAMDRADTTPPIIAGGPCLWVAADDQCPESATEQCAATDVSEQHSYVKQISAVVELDEGVVDRLLRSCQ
jgi:hypothetical protein